MWISWYELARGFLGRVLAGLCFSLRVVSPLHNSQSCFNNTDGNKNNASTYIALSKCQALFWVLRIYSFTEFSPLPYEANAFSASVVQIRNGALRSHTEWEVDLQCKSRKSGAEPLCFPPHHCTLQPVKSLSKGSRIILVSKYSKFASSRHVKLKIWHRGWCFVLQTILSFMVETVYPMGYFLTVVFTGRYLIQWINLSLQKWTIYIWKLVLYVILAKWLFLGLGILLSTLFAPTSELTCYITWDGFFIHILIIKLLFIYKEYHIIRI